MVDDKVNNQKKENIIDTDCLNKIEAAKHITPLSYGEGETAQARCGGGASALLSSTYFGPIQWYQKLHRMPCIIEQHDHFVKQTYRNRCVIATANGTQTLTVPIERYDGTKCAMRDIRISDHGNWRHLHWNALVSAYGETPFFEFYADDLRPFFEKRHTFLFDLNLDIMHTMCQLLDVRPQVTLSEQYIVLPSEDDAAVSAAILTDKSLTDFVDFREAIRPKHPLPDADFNPTPYYQVRAQRHGFLPNLSILDLLFNEGPEGIFYL